MASGPISSWQIDQEKMETVVNFIFSVSKITVDGDCSHKTKGHLILSSVQFNSNAQSCLTVCDPMDCSLPGFPVHHQIPGFAQAHVH